MTSAIKPESTARPGSVPGRLSLAEGLTAALLVALALLLLVQIAQSIHWRMVHDSAILHYTAYLIDRHGFVPYRDIFDSVLPASYLFHLAIGRVLGYGDLAFRVVDIIVLAALLGVTWRLLRPLGAPVAWAAALLFGLLYLGYGPIISLQRDYLGLLPIAIALLLAAQTQPAAGRHVLRLGFIGALFGAAASFKPHLAIGLPVVVLLASVNRRDGVAGTRRARAVIGDFFIAGMGLVVAAVVPLLWVWAQGGLPALADMLRNYLPLYLQMNGEFKILTGLDRLLYLFTSTQHLGGHAVLLMPAVLGGYLALHEVRPASRERRLVGALLLLVVVYGLYPLLAGQFWDYHWLPYTYFAALGASLILVPLGKLRPEGARALFVVAVFALAVVLSVRPAPDFFRQLAGDPPRPPKDGRVDAIADYLRQELRPGDRVQPLDFVSGGVQQAMLLADAVLATRYQFDSQLYHHNSSPYTQARQEDFMSRLSAAPPRFIVAYPDRPRPSGPDTIQHLPELDRFIADNYDVAQAGNGYLIYERTP